MSTIYDIAKETGFSPSTVARVLRQKGYASPKTKEAIRAAASRLGYTPSYAAKVMRTRLSHRILFCVPELNAQFFFRINQKICPVMDAAGYFTLTCMTGSNEEKELEMLNALREDVADGMIMISHNVTRRLIDTINTLEKPVVLINWVPDKRPGDRFHNIFTDVTDGIYKTTKLMIDHGHRDIAFVVGNIDVTTSQSRYLGYKKALEQSGIPLREELVMQIVRHINCSAVCENILMLSPRPTAVVFCSDYDAAQFISVCRRHNLKVPGDISVTGMNDEDIARFFDPPMTTYFLNDSRLGELAAHIMLDSLEGKLRDYQTIRMEGELIYRGTVTVCKE